MPICPKCSATIHAGAEDQCPACGYDITQADELFGDGQVEFTRVVDAAGALTHQERVDLMHALEQLERRIRPVALCVYITDVGQAQELRTHAHWILNHAKIHHPSFGKRELHKAIEDAELRERRPGEARPAEPPPQSWLTTAWQAVRDYVMDALHPLPPPVKHEWMLILVMDVQLEMACFSWGYKLDPFIDPDRINNCIKGARLQFRERAMVTGLKKVMRAAARRISSTARSVNRRLRHAQKAIALAAGLMLLGGSTLAQETAQTTPPAPDGMPHWRADDYRHLMAGDLLTGYTSLLPPEPTPEEIKAAEERKKQLRREQREQRRQQARLAPRTTRTLNLPKESDTEVPAHYDEEYLKPQRNSQLNDPQKLLTTVERADVEHVLRQINSNTRFRIYVAVFKDGQKLHSGLAVNELMTGMIQQGEYAVLVRFFTNNPSALDLGYQEIKLEEPQRLEWLHKVRQAAGDGSPQGLMNALTCLQELISPMADSFTPISVVAQRKLDKLEIQFKETQKKKKDNLRNRVEELMKDPAFVAAVAYPLGFLLGGLGLFLLFNWLRSSSRLEDNEADIRLSSPYGASVSRYVRYLEGTEVGKEKRLF